MKRRNFITNFVAAGAALTPFVRGGIFAATKDKAKTPPVPAPVELDAADPMAIALKYHRDAKKEKIPEREQRPGGVEQFCRNCNYFQAKAGDEKIAPCTIFTGKLVQADAWCITWMQKPKKT